MEIVFETFYGEATGVIDDLIGKPEQTVVVSSDDTMYLIGKILCAISQGLDVKITQFAEEGDE